MLSTAQARYTNNHAYDFHRITVHGSGAQVRSELKMTDFEHLHYSSSLYFEGESLLLLLFVYFFCTAVPTLSIY